MDAIKKDDYARLHFAYHEDTDLAIIADTLDDEHGAGWLVWLYWPRMIARAKQAKSFGWFATTPRKLAASLHDPIAAEGAWAPRQRLWELLTSRDIIRIRQGGVEAPSAKLDVLIVEYEKWQSLSNAEYSRLRRERAKSEAGEPVHWTVEHWSEFNRDTETAVRDTEIVSVVPGATNMPSTEIGVGDTESVSGTTESVSRDTESGGRDTTLNETRQDEGRARETHPLPTTVLTTLDELRDIPGLSRWQMESNVRKAMAQFPSLPDDAVCEAITAFEARTAEGKAVHSAAAWSKLRNCFVVAKRKVEEQATAPSVTAAAPKRRSLEDIIAQEAEVWGEEVARQMYGGAA